MFEVELLRWNEKEVTLDGGVTLKPLDKKGSGWRHPDKTDEVLAAAKPLLQADANLSTMRKLL